MNLMQIGKHSKLAMVFLIGGVLISAGAFFVLQKRYALEKQKQFENNIQKSLILFRAKLEVNERSLLGIVSLFDASEDVTRKDFKIYTRTILKNNSFIQALEWIPKVDYLEKLKFKETAINDGLKTFQIIEKADHNQMITAEKRQTYFPVYYVEPIAGNKRAIGFDLGSNLTRLKSLEEARDTGTTVATSKITLVQEKGSQSGILIFAPIYKTKNIPNNLNDRREQLKGFALGAYRVGDMIEKIIIPHLPIGIGLTIYEEKKTSDKLIYGLENVKKDLMFKSRVSVSGKEWVLIWREKNSVLYRDKISENGLISLGLLIFFVLLSFVMEMIIARTEIIQEEVNVRTHDLKVEIEERKKAEFRAERSARESKIYADSAEASARTKDEFLANISHEVRTPLNGVVGYCSLLEEEELNKNSKEYVKIIKNCSNSLMVIINDILDFSKIETGKLNMNSEPFNLIELIESSMTIFTAQALEKKVKMIYSLGPKVPKKIIGDSHRLRQILINLLGNGLKFTSTGSIVINVSIKEDFEDKIVLLFKIEDTGIGIPEEMKNRLFAPFQQGDSTISRKYGGTGLGLVICRKLVKMMKGNIWLESTEDVGSTFFFTIEAQEVKLGWSQEEEKSEDSVGNLIYTKLKILIAEDNLINQKLAKSLLHKIGYEDVDIVENGKKAVEALSVKSYDVILMDIQMPIMDGYEATKTICQKWDKDNRPSIIGFSANTFQSDIDKGFESGMEEYLQKPIDVERLAAVLQNLKQSA
jgi:two-component system, sensor histidine kinase